jgi:hypothetical protein
MTRTTLDFEAYRKNLDALARISAEIDRLAGFEAPTKAQKSRLESLRSSFRVLDESRKLHERQCLVEGISFDGTTKLDKVSGHTPRPLDDES